MRKVYIVGSHHGLCQYAKMFEHQGWQVVKDVTSADLIQFTGGEDVTPLLYGEKNVASHNNFQRDVIEAGYYAIGQQLHIPMAGICRGGQFLNVMCGGKMWQDVDGHAIRGTHIAIDLATGKEINVTSTHHQMMAISSKGVVLAEANLSTHKINDSGPWWVARERWSDVEAVYYPHTNVLCFQPHPEFPGYQECTDYYFELIDIHLEFKA